jgi:hypothetical protein
MPDDPPKTRAMSKIFVSSQETEAEIKAMLEQFPGFANNRSFLLRCAVKVLHDYMVKDILPGTKSVKPPT